MRPTQERNGSDFRPRAPILIFLTCGIWLIGLGLYFMYLRPPLLPEDLRYIGVTASDVQSAIPGLEGWLQRVFTGRPRRA